MSFICCPTRKRTEILLFSISLSPNTGKIKKSPKGDFNSGGPGRIVNSHIRFRSMGPFRLRCRYGSNRSVLRPTQTKIKIPKRGFKFWWPWSDSNRHSSQNLILSQARLPIPPRGHGIRKRLLCCFLCFNFFYQTCTAVCLVNRFFCRCSRFAGFLFNGFFNRSHFSC